MFNKIKILIIFLLFSFSFNQNMGILKTNKNRSGLGVFVTSNFLYKGNNDGQNIKEIPERYKLQLTYSSKSNFDFSIGAGMGEVIIDEQNKKYNTNFVGVGYHFYKKKWGSSLEIKKTKWSSSTQILKNDNVSLGFSLYSKTKYHPYFSFVNIFFDKDGADNDNEANQEIITFGGMRQIDKFIRDPFGKEYSVILHWGFNIFLEENNFRILKDNASFFLGLGLEFF